MWDLHFEMMRAGQRCQVKLSGSHVEISPPPSLVFFKCAIHLGLGLAVKISMDGKGRYSDNIFVERLWRTVKYEEVHLKAYADGHEARRGLEDYFRFYNHLRPHQALGYRTPAEVFHGEQGVGEEGPDERRCSPRRGALLAGTAGFSLNSALILSK